mgnify:CR=1 FL=1
MDKKRLAFFIFLILGMLFLAACGPEHLGEVELIDYGGQEAGTLEGQIIVDGSSTVFPIMEAVTEEYMMYQPSVRVSVGVSGTGGGFERFVSGETDMNNASRAIEESEVLSLEEAGIEYTELEIAYDGLSIAVNPENDWVDYLTVDELKQMWIEDGSVKKWSDIRPEWPDEEIKFYSPGADSGTFDYFDEVILEGDQIVKKATLSEDDNVLVTGVNGDQYAIGYFGYAYYTENKDKLKIVPIDGGNGPVEPTKETIIDGSYTPLSRSLFLYINNESLQKEEVNDFIKFLLHVVGDLSEEVGYVGLPEEKYAEQLEMIKKVLEKNE